MLFEKPQTRQEDDAMEEGLACTAVQELLMGVKERRHTRVQ